MMQASVAIVCYCSRCDYFIKTAVQADAIGTHFCVECDGPMEVYIAQGASEIARWHEHPESKDSDRRDALRVVLTDGIEAMLLTRDYVGQELLPAKVGWSWFDWIESARRALAVGEGPE